MTTDTERRSRPRVDRLLDQLDMEAAAGCGWWETDTAGLLLCLLSSGPTATVFTAIARLLRDGHDPDVVVGAGSANAAFGVAEEWLDAGVEVFCVRASTSYRYTWMVDHYINPSIGIVPLRRLRADHLDGLYDQLATTGGRQGTGLAPKTVHEVHVIVRSSLDLAVRRRLVDSNVAHATNARHKRQTRTVPRSWTAAELASFLGAARQHRLYPALHLTACTGMRRGEIAGLRWSDLDRPNQRLSISRTLQSIAGQPVEFPVKTRTSRRCIDLDNTTMDVLARRRRRLAREGLTHGPDEWMFLNTAGRFLNPESLSQLFDGVHRPRIREHTKESRSTLSRPLADDFPVRLEGSLRKLSGLHG